MEGGTDNRRASERALLGGIAAVAMTAAIAVAAVALVAGIVVEGRATTVAAGGQGNLPVPREAIIDLTRTGKEKWRSALGPDCRLDDVFVMVVGSGPEGYDVVSMPGACHVNRFTVAPDDGGIRPEDPFTRED